ncbi:MAG: hypothetical protein A3H98_14200 [Bacteroidetes bacterium RIFCSPLOWO2_02_FULL_36_8]|nr:MAG: hypothetical protein A3H98_14200 [Bacteroidetes bacterium RIFCSPLOWO2_02_FULL_36_8]OFY69231.1 MAG: hypothetical protein A3G23_06110 [Bacteroidetes bacterium RIFCSPLOWO2_12_FULL_37_12]
MSFVFNLHRTMLNHKFILIYEGEFSQDITKILALMAEKKMGAIGEESNIIKKIFGITVECLQNISKHAAFPKEELNEKSSIFTIGRDNDWYYISTGNLISNPEVDALKLHLEEINTLTQDELKTKFKETMSGRPIDEKSNCGLGLIEIARKSKEKLLFDFIPFNEEYSFFLFQTKVKSN